MCSRCDQTALPEASVADLLSFEAWPEELQRIARAALGEHMAMLRADVQEDVRSAAQEEQQNMDEDRYERILLTIDRLRLRVTALADGIDKLAVPDEPFADKLDAFVTEAEDIATELDTLPRTLDHA